MNATMTTPSPPVTMVRLPYPIDINDEPHVVMIVVLREDPVAVSSANGPFTVADDDEEPTWEDAECL